MARGRLLAVAALALAAVHLLGPDAGWSALWSGAAPGRLLAWYDQVGPARAGITSARLAAGVGCGWLALSALLQVGATACPLPWFGRLVDRLSPALLRRLAGGAVVASVSVGPTLAAGAGPTGDPAGTATMEVIEPSSPTRSGAAASAAVPVPLVLPEPSAPEEAPPSDAAPAAAPPVEEVRVELGDSFWRLAVEAVREARGPAASEAEVARYWRRLVAANRDRLVDPGNADLLLPGQVLVLPPT